MTLRLKHRGISVALLKASGTNMDRVSASSVSGFRAHVQGLALRDLVTLQHQRGATGVFAVLSGDRSGSLHFSNGTLMHAETRELSGDAAALEILSWSHGEFIDSQPSQTDRCSVTRPLDGLLQQLSASSSSHALEPPLSATGVRRKPDATAGASKSAAPGLAAAATPGIAAVPPSARASDGRFVTGVLVSARGEIVSAQGPDPELLAGRIAYLSRLAELIGQAMGSGDVRAIRLRDASSELNARRYADGSLSGSLSATAGPTPRANSVAPAPAPRSPLPVVNLALHSLRDIDGVYGSFVANGAGETICRDLPAIFDDATLAESSLRVARFWEAAQGDRAPDHVLLEFSEYCLFIRAAGASCLCIVVPQSVNILALKLASKVVARQLELGARAFSGAS